MTKRIFLPLSLTAAAVLISGCAAVSPPSLSLGEAELPCTVNTDGAECECTALYLPDGSCRVAFTSPEVISGLTAELSPSGSAGLSFGSLSCSGGSISLPPSSPAVIVYDVLRDISAGDKKDKPEKSDDGYIFSGSCGEHGYKAFADKEGKMTRLEIS